MGAKLSPYDIVALLPSGTVLAAGLYLICYGWPAQSDLQSISAGFGDFGLVLLGVFVAGELIHAVARLLERAYWRCFAGWPTERLIGSACHVLPMRRLEGLRSRLEQWSWSEQLVRLSPSQKTMLYDRIRKMIKHGDAIAYGDIAGITREMYVQVFNAKSGKRVDVFNRNYGLYSGLLVTFAFLSLLAGGAAIQSYLETGYPAWAEYELGLAVAFSLGVAICAIGTWTTGYDYAGELVLQFLNLPQDEPGKHAPAAIGRLEIVVENRTVG